MNIQYCYEKFPYAIQTILFNLHCKILYRKRYCDFFYSSIEELERTQWFSEADFSCYQNMKLKKLIEHAYHTVPYYNEIMKKHRLSPSDITTVADLVKFPILTRKDVLMHGDKMLSTKFEKKELFPGHTSGTTGSPLNFYWDRGMWIVNHAYDWRQKQWAGLMLGSPYCVLLGRAIVAPCKDKPPYWQLNKYDNQLWLSSFHLSQQNIDAIFDKICEFSPEVIEGYPSTLYVLAKLLEENNYSFPLKATLTSSETLYNFQLEKIRSVFNCENFDFYGLAERVAWATECEKHTGKHLNMEYGITEIVNHDDESVIPGENGFLVGTSLHNYGMPFIRYKTTDFTSISLEKCPCGRKMPLLGKVTTKAEDLIRTPSGKFISSSTLTHPFKPLHHIEMSQIIQEELGLIIIKIVKRQGYTSHDSKRLLEEFVNRVGPGVDVRLEFVSSIPREESGKFKWVISRLEKTDP